MDNRRQLALQRKAEEEKAKALEEERKMKEEAERRKKEREDLTDKRSLKPSTSKRVSKLYLFQEIVTFAHEHAGGRE
jgi:hypothetical protein